MAFNDPKMLLKGSLITAGLCVYAAKLNYAACVSSASGSAIHLLTVKRNSVADECIQIHHLVSCWLGCFSSCCAVAVICCHYTGMLPSGSVAVQLLSAVAPRETCSSYRCAVTHHKCSAALFIAKCSFHCSVLLCKTGSQQAVCQCSYIYGDMLFIQVCSDPPQMLCSKFHGKMQFPRFSVALQNRLTAGSVALQLHLWRLAHYTGVQ